MKLDEDGCLRAGPTENAALLAQLTAAEEQLAAEKRESLHWMAIAAQSLEQLAEMRNALFGARRFVDGVRKFAEHMNVPTKPSEDIVTMIDKALSAAPKRGRVLWEGNGRIREEAGYHEDEQSSYHYTAYYVEPLKITDFDAFLVGTDLDAKCKWLYNDLLVTVTVREAE